MEKLLKTSLMFISLFVSLVVSLVMSLVMSSILFSSVSFASLNPDKCLDEVSATRQFLWQQSLGRAKTKSKVNIGVLKDLELRSSNVSPVDEGPQNYSYTSSARYVEEGKEGYYYYFTMLITKQDCSITMVHQSITYVELEKKISENN